MHATAEGESQKTFYLPISLLQKLVFVNKLGIG